MNVEFVLSKQQEEMIQMRINMAINGAVEKNKSSKYIGKDYLRLGETADYLGIANTTLRNFIDNYGLKVSIIDGTKFISKKNIADFMASFET